MEFCRALGSYPRILQPDVAGGYRRHMSLSPRALTLPFVQELNPIPYAAILACTSGQVSAKAFHSAHTIIGICRVLGCKNFA